MHVNNGSDVATHCQLAINNHNGSCFEISRRLDAIPWDHCARILPIVQWHFCLARLYVLRGA